MGSSDVRDVLTCFSPSMDFFAISSGDGRIKIWDAIKGQLQTEFSDLVSTDETDLLSKSQRGHLSVDYTCMKWAALDREKKRKLGSSFLVVGTGSGDVLAIDVSAGQLKWKFNDCHPGGVTSISFSKHVLCICTSGADGMICEIEPDSGNLMRKFKASTKPISAMSVSADGKILATAAGRMKILKCSDHTKIQTFSGHPGNVRCMILTADGNYAISCAGGERYVAVWRIDGGKEKSATCVLAMEHPAVYLDAWCMENVEAGGMWFYVLAISEKGVCYFWCGEGIDELQKTKPTKISLSLNSDFLKEQKGHSPAIFAAKIQNAVKPAAAQVFVAHGFLVRPSFEKIMVHRGSDLELNISQTAVLLPSSQSAKSKKRLDVQSGATALDRANAEGALIPIPKIFEIQDAMKKDQLSEPNSNEAPTGYRDDHVDIGDTDASTSMEDRLRSLGILDPANDLTQKSMTDSALLKGIDLDSTISPKKMRAAVLSMTPAVAGKVLFALISLWQSRACSGKHVLPWVYCLLVIHGQALSEDHESGALDSLYRIAKSKAPALQDLLQLFGRFQLIMAQVNKTSQHKTQILPQDNEILESEDEDIDEVTFGIEQDVTETSSDDDAA